MNVTEVLPIFLYILGIILLVVLIILTIKTILIMDKVDKTVDNINGKLDATNDLFNMISLVTGKFNFVTNKIIDSIVLLVEKIFKGKDNEDGKEK